MAGAASLVRTASELAEARLSSVGPRWHHVQGVATQAHVVGPTVPYQYRELLLAAAWLHDIGYAPDLRHTAFHPLDSARYLEAKGVERPLVCLVAHHSAARFEAKERGLAGELAVFELEEGPVMDALVYADMTTGPQGERVSFEQRVSEILDRYDPDDPVYRAISRAKSTLAGSVGRTQQRLAARGN